jgi:Ca-activated chloride channel homolog
MDLGRPELCAIGLAFLGLLGTGIALWVRRRHRVAAALGDRAVMGRLIGPELYDTPWFRVLAVGAAGLALAGAMLNPPRPALPSDASRDIVLVLDVSNSMLVEDLPPNRLERMREIARELLNGAVIDRIGVVAYAGEAVVLTPPTRDRRSVAMYLDALSPAIAAQTGSAAGSGLRQAAALLAAGPALPGGRVALLIGDGEPVGIEERDDVIEAARRAAALGVTVYTVGVGTAMGGAIPDVDFERGVRVGYKRDPESNEIAVSRQHADVLTEIGQLTGGRYVDAADRAAVTRLVTSLSRDGAADDGVSTMGGGWSVWFAGLAVLLLGFDAAREAGRSRPRRVR